MNSQAKYASTLVCLRLQLQDELYMKKLDHKKDLKHLYNPSARKVTVVEVPKMNFLMIDGVGDPNTEKSFGDAIWFVPRGNGCPDNAYRAVFRRRSDH